MVKKYLFIIVTFVFSFNFFSQSKEKKIFYKLNDTFLEVIHKDNEAAFNILKEQKLFISLNNAVLPDTLIRRMQIAYYKNYSSYLRDENSIDSAIIYNKKYINVAKELGDRKYIATGYHELGLIFKSQFKNKEALNNFKFSLKEFLSLKDSTNITASYHSLASLYSRVKNYDTAIFYLNKSLNYVDSSKYPDDYATIYNSIGFQSYQKGDYDFAFANYLKSLKIYESTGNWQYEIMNLEQIGALYFYQEDFTLALEYFSKVLVIARENEKEKILASSYINIGAVYVEIGKKDKAIINFNQALLIAEKLDYKVGMSACYSNLGGLYIDKGDFIKGTDLLEKSIFLDKEKGDKGELAHSYYNLGNAYYKRNLNKNAEVNLNKGLALAIEVGKLEVQKNCYEKLSEVLFTQKQYVKAWGCNKNYLLIKDSINAIEVKKNINQLKVEFETQLKEVENEKLKAEVEVKNQEIISEQKSFWYSLIIAAVVFLLLISFIIILFNRNKNKKQKIEIARLEILKKEKEAKEVFNKLNESKNIILEKNYLINQLSKEIDLGLNSGEFAENLLNKISNDNDWGNFMNEFEILHKGFFSRLLLHNNSLTNNDLRLSSLIKLNLSDKEIAGLINIEYTSVKKSKNRLKKKLALSTEQKLSNYIKEV